MFLPVARIAEQHAKCQAAMDSQTEVHVKCTQQFVQNVAERPKFLSSRVAISQFIVQSVSRTKETDKLTMSLAVKILYYANC
jgi:hypothetical protein